MPQTNIGHDVWIGYGARIKAGVSIGHGAVVGMGAIVTKDVPPCAVVAGNPARVVSQRFPNAIAAALQASKWWDMDDTELRQAAQFFTEPEAFLKSKGLL